jgi:hypothetical protein
MRCFYCGKPGADKKVDMGGFIGPQGRRNKSPRWAHEECRNAALAASAAAQSDRDQRLREMCIAVGLDPADHGLH